MLINLDELENPNRSEIGSLKELITKTHIRIRRAYGHNNETLPRCASFAGSVNTAQFLNDTTGSRRFLSFEVTDIKYDHKVSLNDVYSQALHLFKSGFRFWFNRDEIGAINQNNEQYQLRSPEEELLLTWFESCTKEQANAFLTASQILAKLADKAKINVSDSSVNKLGKALIKNNYLRFKSNGKLLYALRELQWEDVESRNRSLIEEFSGNVPKSDSNSPTQPIEIQGDCHSTTYFHFTSMARSEVQGRQIPTKKNNFFENFSCNPTASSNIDEKISVQEISYFFLRFCRPSDDSEVFL